LSIGGGCWYDHPIRIPFVSAILIPFLSAFALSLALVPAARAAATRLGCVAVPKSDRWHRRPTALFGGVAIALSVLALVPSLLGIRQHGVLLASSAMMFLLGLVDDIRALRPSTKLVAEAALASLFLFFGYRLGWSSSLSLDAMLTVLWIVGITNAFNLLDNMDGLCGGLAVIAAVALLFGLLPADPGSAQFAEAQYIAILLGATCGFLVYNVHPASIFMGDSGALFLGLNLAVLAFGRSGVDDRGSNLMSIVAAPIVVLLIPILDTTLVTLSRILSGRSASVGGRDHSSHRLVSIGLSERGAVAVLWTLAAAAGSIGVAMRQFTETWPLLFALLFIVGMTLFAVYLARVRVYEDSDEMIRRGRITPLVVNFVATWPAAEVVLDLCLVSVSYYAAYRLRFDGTEFAGSYFAHFMESLPLVLATQMIALFVVGAYRTVWRYFGLSDVIVFGKGVVLGCLVSQLAVLYVFQFVGYSRGVFVLSAILLLFLLVASRASFQLIGEFVSRRRHAGRRVVIYGAGDGGRLLARELLNDRNVNYKLLGFIDDDPAKHRLRVQGYQVLGSAERLAGIVEQGEVDEVIVSTPALADDRLRELQVLCDRHEVSLSRLHFAVQQLIAPGPQPIPFPRAGSGRGGRT
jgi:UDP-GlcNAc:undecaprenyl-phosphate GlcNAc-1-phosphate transferase